MLDVIVYLVPVVVLIAIVALGLHVNKEWEQAIILRLGKYHRLQRAGIFYTIPFIEAPTIVDIRTRTLDIPAQEAITKDNISVKVDAVVFFKIEDTNKAILNVNDYMYAVRQFSQTTLRNVIGEKNLDEILERREDIAKAIRSTVDQASKDWGVDIEKVELQNIELPEDMKRIMARQAEAEREKRGVIIASEGELEAATNLIAASKKLEESLYGYRLRELQTISDVSQDRSNTIIFVPSESLNSTLLSAGIAARVPKDNRDDVEMQ